MTRGKLIILLSLFTLLSLFSISTVYYTHQLSTEEVRTTTLGTYKHTGTYDYVAKLKSNIMYNQSTLKPGEGTLYTEITEYLNTTFSYNFQTSQEANVTIEYSVDMMVESSEWSKPSNIVPRTTITSKSNITEFSNNYLLNITSIKELRDIIQQETRSKQTDYNVTLRPEIHVSANNDLTTIDEYFTPTMTMTFKHGTTKGNYISTTDLEHTRSEAITDTQIIPVPAIMNYRYASYAFCATTLSALAATVWAFTRRLKPSLKPPKPIEEIMAPYEEIVVETTGEPPSGQTTIFETESGDRYFKERKPTINVKTLEDLVKVADWLGKPVLSYQKTSISKSKEVTRVFYVLDGTTRYKYTITAPTITQEEAESETLTGGD